VKNGKKVTSWWNQQLKDVVQAKKVANKLLLHSIADSSLDSQYAEPLKSAGLTVKQSNINLGRILDINWIPITG